jgi:hypothetical protein
VQSRIRRLDEQVGGPVASHAPSPDRLVVGGQVELDTLGDTRFDHPPGHLAQVGVETASGHRPHRRPVESDELTGRQTPVGGPADTDHRRQRERGSRLRPRTDRVEYGIVHHRTLFRRVFGVPGKEIERVRNDVEDRLQILGSPLG